jgi:hypothetical protein
VPISIGPNIQLQNVIGCSMTLDPVLKEAAFAELAFEADRLLEAWNELRARVAKGDSVLAGNPIAESTARWDCADRMLTHAVRIDRILQPQKGQDSPESQKAREETAAELGKLVNLSLSHREKFRAARNSIEHSDERLPGFVDANPKKALGPFSVGPDADQGIKRNYVPLRALNTLTWDCTVIGDRVNLKELVDAVRDIKFHLPSPGVSPKFIPRDEW